MNKNNGWYGDENQCEATFRCPYINFCYNNIDVKPGDEPENFVKAKWVDEKEKK